MISITPYSYSPILRTRKQTPLKFTGGNIRSLIESGDRALNENRDKDALSFYLQAQKQEPENAIINKKIAKAYHKLKDYKSAETNFQIYLKDNSGDAETWIDLGESQRQQGKYKNAIRSFETAQRLDPNNDLARRSILEAKNNELSIISTQKAYEEKQKYANKNLQEAMQMTISYMTPEFMSDISDVEIKFGQTASMGGTANIAQYENSKKTITVSEKYKYASPVVIAAYLVHESVHAKDKDAYTSVREEQDAYAKATEFWIKNSNGIKDPEMDYAAQLYNQSPEKLSKRVEEIYIMRDPSIAKTSPNHPPTKRKFFNSETDAASQPIKTYNVIA